MNSAAGLDYDRALLVMVHLLRCPELLQSYFDPISRVGLFKSWQNLQFIWDSVSAYQERYQRSIPRHLLEYDLKQRLSDGLFTPPSPDVFQTVDSAFRMPAVDLTEAFAADVLKEVLSNQLRQELKLQLDGATGDAIPKLLSDAGKQYTATLSSKPVFVKPFKNHAGNMVDAAKSPVGIPWLDGILGGGMCPGDMLGLVLPSGCGKTTFAVQVAEAGVKQQRRTDIAAFEQNIKGDISLRTSVVASASTRADWQAYTSALQEAEIREKLEVLPEGVLTSQVEQDMARYVKPEVLQRFINSRAAWDKYVTWVDFTKPDVKIPNINALFDYLDMLTEETKLPPHTLIIDWWGLIVGRMLSLQNFRSDQQMRLFRGEQLSVLKRQLQARRMSGIVLHQLSGQEGKKGHKHTPNAYSSAEDSSFLHAFDAVLVSGTQNSLHQIRLMGDKLRKFGSNGMLIQIDGEHCKLEQVSGFGQSVGMNPDNSFNQAAWNETSLSQE